jgi:hypothetical protein
VGIACVAPTCGDGVKNGGELAVDCGGGCLGCPTGTLCASGVDCLSQVCAAGACKAASCNDGLKNGSETDADCGGPSCATCALGKGCQVGGDCASGGCFSGSCAARLVISEIRSRGPGGPTDDFIELYNPTNVPVTLDASWALTARSAIGPCAMNAPVLKFLGVGQVVQPHRHFLLAGAGYTQMPVKDAVLFNGDLLDAGAVRLVHGDLVVDTVCYAFDAPTQAALLGCASPYVCEGTPVNNLPHDGSASAASNANTSIVRKPGGAGGSTVDTNDNASDFLSAVSPATPENVFSPAVP